MEALGINTGLLLVQIVSILLLIVLVITLIDLSKKKNERRTAGGVGAHHMCGSASRGVGVLDH